MFKKREFNFKQVKKVAKKHFEFSTSFQQLFNCYRNMKMNGFHKSHT